MTTNEWLVIRQDDNGNIYVVSAHATQVQALREAAAFEARAHKQMYSVVRRDQFRSVR